MGSPCEPMGVSVLEWRAEMSPALTHPGRGSTLLTMLISPHHQEQGAGLLLAAANTSHQGISWGVPKGGS